MTNWNDQQLPSNHPYYQQMTNSGQVSAQQNSKRQQQPDRSIQNPSLPMQMGMMQQMQQHPNMMNPAYYSQTPGQITQMGSYSQLNSAMQQMGGMAPMGQIPPHMMEANYAMHQMELNAQRDKQKRSTRKNKEAISSQALQMAQYYQTTQQQRQLMFDQQQKASKQMNRSIPTTPGTPNQVPSTPPVQNQPATNENSIQGDMRIIKQALGTLTNDRIDIFIKLFDIGNLTNKKLNERIELFFNQLLPALMTSNPNTKNIVLFLLEKLQNQVDFYNNVTHPHLPIFFKSEKACTPTYRMVRLVPHGFEYVISTQERKHAKVSYFLGFFMSLGDPVPPLPIFVDRVMVKPAPYGEQFDFYYLLGLNNASNMKIAYQLPETSVLTWFVMQCVTKLDYITLLSQYVARIGIVNVPPERIIFKTAHCPNLSLNALSIFNEISNTGFAICPQCGAPLAVSQMTFDVYDEAQAPPESISRTNSKSTFQQLPQPMQIMPSTQTPTPPIPIPTPPNPPYIVTPTVTTPNIPTPPQVPRQNSQTPLSQTPTPPTPIQPATTTAPPPVETQESIELKKASKFLSEQLCTFLPTPKEPDWVKVMVSHRSSDFSKIEDYHSLEYSNTDEFLEQLSHL